MTTPPTSRLEIAANRRARKWTQREMVGRLAWEALSGPLFSWTPRPFWAWRRAVLRLFGARVGRAVQVHPSVRIAVPWNLTIEDDVGIGERAILYALGPIVIRHGATISQYAHLCAGTHDFRRPDLPLLKLGIEIGAGAWICADAFVAPGVAVGEMAVVGARAVVVRDVGPGTVVAGNPARQVNVR